jgi:hypothetical protein
MGRKMESRKWLNMMEKVAGSTEAGNLDGPEDRKKKQKLSMKVDQSIPPVKTEPEPEGVVIPSYYLKPDLTPSPPPVDMSIIHGPADIALKYEDSSPGFPYEPLDIIGLEIRVVILKPGTKSAPVECDLEHVPTSKRSKPSYKALSYTWGSPEIRKTIRLQGMAVQVRENLWQALYHLRSPDTSLRLWVDAISINQDDISERNEQVSRMGTIYNLATEVIVWLGPHKDRSKLAITFIQDNMHTRRKLQPDFLKDSFQEELQAVLDLTRREYWRRVWIIQEVFKARTITIHCGFDRLPWTFIGRFFRHLEKSRAHLGLKSNPKFDALLQSLAAKLSEHRSYQKVDLETLLTTYRYSQCCDPRDKVYSLLGLAKRKLRADSRTMDANEWVTIDYSTSPQELFRSLMLKYSNETIRLSPHKGSLLEVRRMQMLQESLALPAPWYDWQLSGFHGVPSIDRPDKSTSSPIRCETQCANSVSKIGPIWSPTMSNTEPIISWYKEFHGPDMPSVTHLTKALDSFGDDDIARLRSTPTELGDGENGISDLEIDERKDDCNNKITVEIRLFTTHQGRLGFTCCDISSQDIVARFSGCDVALVVQGQGADLDASAVKGRAFFLKSDTRPHRGTTNVESSATLFLDDRPFRWAIPDILDETGYHSIRNADIEKPKRVWNSSDSNTHSLWLSLAVEEWQFWTW